MSIDLKYADDFVVNAIAAARAREQAARDRTAKARAQKEILEGRPSAYVAPPLPRPAGSSAAPADAPMIWRLTRTEARLYSLLAARDWPNYETLERAFYGDNPPASNSLTVYMCRVRSAVEPYGVVIETFRSGTLRRAYQVST